MGNHIKTSSSKIVCLLLGYDNANVPHAVNPHRANIDVILVIVYMVNSLQKIEIKNSITLIDDI